MPSEMKTSPFAIGDIVYILGKYLPDSKAPLLLMECKILHIKHKRFVAHRTDGKAGEWSFSKMHYNKCVFTDKDKAAEEWNRRANEESAQKVSDELTAPLEAKEKESQDEMAYVLALEAYRDLSWVKRFRTPKPVKENKE